MAAPAYYAGSYASLNQNNRLPSPNDAKITKEQLWDENAGRNANGEMIATFKASKNTYVLSWKYLDATQFGKVQSLLTTGFFYFAKGVAGTNPSGAALYYRSEIAYDEVYNGELWYKDVSVSVIQK